MAKVTSRTAYGQCQGTGHHAHPVPYRERRRDSTLHKVAVRYSGHRSADPSPAPRPAAPVRPPGIHEV